MNISANFTSHNKVKLLLDGNETFSAIMEVLRSARRNINLEYFLICNDKTGNTIKNILIERSQSGVDVRVIYDAVGSWRLGRNFVNELESAGVRVKRFMPVKFSNIGKGIIHRDHRKIITADGVTGLLGGFNIGDVYLRQWKDTHLMLRGEAVGVLDGIFADMWGECSNSECIPAGDVSVKIVASGRGKDFRAVADEYIRIISGANNRVWITTPYLVPDRPFREALYRASQKGVDVRIIVPLRSNHAAVSWASQSYIDELIRNGIKIFFYGERFVHAKTLIIDSEIASVGTANLDALSFSINYEVQAFVYSADIVRELEDVFIRDLEHCTEITPQNRKNRPLFQRVKEYAGRLLSPIL